jgi:formylglycine-generating enzyme required for sulfatase activity
MVGNLDEWTADPNGTFQGGFWLDTSQHGDGCAYRTIAHPYDYHDYSTGFRCCADPSEP